MDHKKIAVFGIYTSATAAEQAVDILMQAGFSNNAISALLPDQQGTKDFALLSLVGMDIPEYEAKRYEGHLKAGGVLLSVVSDATDVTRAKGLLTGTGAVNIASTGEAGVGSSEAAQPVTG